jgi:hypothetical protein
MIHGRRADTFGWTENRAPLLELKSKLDREVGWKEVQSNGRD